ncbi:Toll-like receptor Tollo [Holothuria leucospilota]|uniref:Toll-like receptor Tollo n=1 Tax=Holothuria leucospilota TaxID=206669 RepID=A0A9Q1BVA7_HOLLE|nr:Toll-like receptor Tollo [Holothuria leucospilota]
MKYYLPNLGIKIFFVVYLTQGCLPYETNVTECDLDWSCRWNADLPFDLIDAHCFYQATVRVSNSSFNRAQGHASLTVYCGYEAPPPPSMLKCMLLFAGIAQIKKLHIFSCNPLKIYDGDLDPFTSLEEFNSSYSDLEILEDHVFYHADQLRTINLKQHHLPIGIQKFPKALIGPTISTMTLSNISRYQQRTTTFLPSLRNLLLDSFVFSYGIPRYAFLNHDGLEMLSLTNTRLNSAELENLSPLSNLTRLDVLQNMEMEEIPVNLFPYLQNLKHLEIDGGAIRVIQKNDFIALPGLEFLSLSSLGITSFHPHAFETLTNLRTLKIAWNLFLGLRHSLPPLKGLSLLQNLDMASCKYTNITADVFKHVEKLRTLNLKFNNLAGVPFVFNNNPESSVVLPESETVDLSENKILSLASYTFSNLEKLKRVDLSYNRIQNIAEMAFHNLKTLEEIILSGNMINIFEPRSIVFIETLKILDLRWNYLYNFPKLPEVNTRLGIDKIPENPFFTYLEGNPLICDCLMFSELFELNMNGQWVLPNTSTLIWPGARSLVNQRFDSLRLSCFTAFGLQHLESMVTAPEDFFSFLFPEHGCPFVCNCYYHCATSWSSAFCNNKDLTEVPKNFNLTILWLGLANNFITSLPKDAFDDLSSLEGIDLKGNQMNHIESGTFYQLSNLRFLFLNNNNLTRIENGIFNITSGGLEELNLSSNFISAIDQGAFDETRSIRRLELDNNNIKSLPYGIFDNLENLSYLKIGGNPFNCSCDILYLTNWYKETSFETDRQLDTDINDLGCPSFFNDTELFNWVKQQDILCNPPPTFHQVTINIPVSNIVRRPSANSLTVFLSCLISSFIATVFICVITYKYRLAILALIYVKTGRKFFSKSVDDSKKQYDAFISFSNLDRDFILEELVPKLEGSENRRKLCIHHRDFIVGECIATNIVNAIENSKRIVILCSKNYLESEWCSYEFKASHRQALKDKRHRIILIMMNDVDDETLDKDIKAYITNNTYLKRQDSLFWSKLLYSVPTSNQKLKSSLINDGQTQDTTAM